MIRLPKEDIDYSHLEAIVIDQLGISWWEFDYLLGENGINPNSL